MSYSYYGGTQQYDGGYTAATTGQGATLSGRSTTVRFHVLMDRRHLQSGDRVLISGNLPVLTDWGHGVEMNRDTSNQNIWYLDVDMPFGTIDYHAFGLFEYKFIIESPTEGQITETRPYRDEKRIQNNFYASFKPPNYYDARFRATSQLFGRALFEPYICAELEHLDRGETTAAEIMSRFLDLVTSCFGAYNVATSNRSIIEDLFDQAIRDGPDMPPAKLLLFLAMIGHFGLTSREVIYTYPQNTGGGAYGGFGYGMATTTYKTPPRPSLWCTHMVEAVDIPALYSLEWTELIGVNGFKAAQGLAEAIERFAEHGSFKWLFILPLVKKFEVNPKLDTTVAKKQGKKTFVDEEGSFLFVASRICSLAKGLCDAEAATSALSEISLSEKAPSGGASGRVETPSMVKDHDVVDVDASAASTTTPETIPASEIKSTAMVLFDEDYSDPISGVAGMFDRAESERAKLSRAWFAMCIRHSPSLVDLKELIITFMNRSASHILKPICAKVSSLGSLDDEDFETLSALLDSMVDLQSPEILTAVLQVPSLLCSTTKLIMFANLCMGKFDFQDQQKPPAKSEPSADLILVTEAEFISGKWFQLSTAMKDWFRSRHSVEPARAGTDDDDDDDNSWWSAWGQKKKKSVKKVVVDQVAVSRDALSTALDDLSILLSSQIFLKNYQGLLFEFRRCWFLNGPSERVFEVLLKLASGTDSFNSYNCATLAQDLTREVVRVLKDFASTQDNARKSIEMIERHILTVNATVELAHHLLYCVVVFTSWPSIPYNDVLEANASTPSLQSIFENNGVWKMLLSWADQDFARPSGASGVILANLLARVRNALLEVNRSLSSKSVELQTLHVIVKNSSTFLDILELSIELRSAENKVTSLYLDSLEKSLRVFDKTFEQVQTYASFFCSCGVNIDSEELRFFVLSIRSRYNNIKLLEVEDIFRPLQALPHVAWLYQLRNSELFIQIWRSVGRQVIFESVDRQQNGEFRGFVSLFNNLLDEGEEEHGDDGSPDDNPEAAADARLRDQEMKIRINQLVESHFLNQDDVTQHLIPNARIEWEKLAESTYNGTITLNRLDQTFGKLDSDNIVRDELRLLSSCTSVQSILGIPAKREVFDKVRSQLRDYKLLQRLCNWLPSLIRLHSCVTSLCETELEDDVMRKVMTEAYKGITDALHEQRLASIANLVSGVKEIFARFNPDCLDFLTVMSTCPPFIEWLLAHNETDEFNKLLQVVRPCTDEPRLISAIASLVNIRTSLLDQMYSTTKFRDFQAFVLSFERVDLGSSRSVVSDRAIWHLENVIGSFDALYDVFEKQTRSPGIKSCYDLKDIFDRGTFILSSSADSSKVLSLETVKAEGEIVIDSVEFLLDLRSNLLMTEVPEELENEFQVGKMIEAFVSQLQTLAEISDVVSRLFTLGHIGYQLDFSMRRKFTLEGMDTLKEDLKSIQEVADNWEKSVKESRSSHYYLNYFTMREILRMRQLALSPSDAENPTTSIQERGIPVASNLRDVSGQSSSQFSVEEDAMISQVESMGFDRLWSIVALKKNNWDVSNAINFIFSNDMQRERLCEEEILNQQGKTTGTGAADDLQDDASDSPFLRQSPSEEFYGMLHLISSSVSLSDSDHIMGTWAAALHAGIDVLESLGNILNETFGAKPVSYRRISPPGEAATNRADMLVVLDEEAEKRLPIFVACTSEVSTVIDAALSVYVRRGRIPEPGEVLFCTPETTVEDLYLVLMRFIRAKSHGLEDSVYCIADIHNLSYSQQCTLVEMIRQVVQDVGQQNASTLLLLSGLPKQVAMNSLSSQAVDLPPLQAKDLRKACKEAFSLHCGETQCVYSTINGGGKSHYIMETIAERQNIDPCLVYRKVPIRESTNSQRLVEMLTSVRKLQGFAVAFHIDIAHIIPAAANTILFQLLCVGVLRDPLYSRVYHRSKQDIFMLEIPNSPKNKTAIALRFPSLLPAKLMEVNEANLKLTKPQQLSRDRYGSQITNRPYDELIYVCRWLQAVKNKTILPKTASYNQEFSPLYSDEPISPSDCFALLKEVCCSASGPSPQASWSLFHSFITFMYNNFRGMETYGLFVGGVSDSLEGLQTLRYKFARLLVETGKDFSLRSVHQLMDVGITADEYKLEHRTSSNNEPGGDLFRSPSTGPLELRREKSSEVRRAEEEAASRAPLVRHSSDEMVDRFHGMKSWEDSDHPIALFQLDPRTGEVGGINIISLNPQFLSTYIDETLRSNLKFNSIEFEKDWQKLSNADGVEILRAAEGLDRDALGGIAALESGYVMTVDNVLKMLSMQMRLRLGLPVVIMGETGCGKSTLIRNLCAVLGCPLRTLNVHGGMEDTDIVAWMTKQISAAEKLKGCNRIIVFLDEVNTCNCMGLFKEIVCDRTMNGMMIPDKIQIIAACNPYRLRTGRNLYGGEEMAGLIFEHFSQGPSLENVGTGIKDPLRNLVYRVHPLPEAMIDYIFDFGSLSEDTEALYIKAMIRKQIGVYCAEEVEEVSAAPIFSSPADLQQQGLSPEILMSLIRDRETRFIPAAQRVIRLPGHHSSTLFVTSLDTRNHSAFYKIGFVYKAGEEGLGYYRDGPRGGLDDDDDDDGLAFLDEEDEDDVIDGSRIVRGARPPDNSDSTGSQPRAPDIERSRDRKDGKGKAFKSPYAALSPFEEFIEVFCKLTCAAQEKIRELYGNERSSASLRDVARCVRVFLWFGRYFESIYGGAEGWSVLDFFSSSNLKVQKHVRKAVFLSLAYCYYARLPREERDEFLKHIVASWKALQEIPAVPAYGQGHGRGAVAELDSGQNRGYSGYGYGYAATGYGGGYTAAGYPYYYYQPPRPRLTWLELNNPVAFLKVLHETQRQFVDVMNLGDGIALNEALCENLFMVMVSVLNQIPIIVIGKPGSSKSLAMGLIQSNLKGKASDHPFLKTLPAVEVFSYQCSPLSTSSGIESAFEKARRYLRESTNTIVVVLLDEVGLAEQSPHLPLKVLHKVLDEAAEGESVVGISNWSLDPAKMNRAVHLYRPAPTVEDLSLTAEGMVKSANLKGYLHALARAYSSTYSEQEHPDFWGLREFYSTVRSINTALQFRRIQAEKEDNEDHVMMLDESILLNSVLRNFGGRPQELHKIVDCFFENLGLPLNDGWDQTRVEDLIIQNIKEPDARHLMLLTKNNAALSLLFDRNILQQERTEIIFGSDFPLDQTDLQICLNIQRIKVCMAEGITVILVHCESLYESLYDLLNQHYTTWGGMKYVRLAFGTNTRQCPIHPNFRIICVVEKQEAYTKLAPPLLNRFEKQVFERRDVIKMKHIQMLERLENFARIFAISTVNTSASSDVNLSALRAAFCGYHSDLISSLLLATEAQYHVNKKEEIVARVDEDEDETVDTKHTDTGKTETDIATEIFTVCIYRLLWIATPESTCSLVASRKGEIVREIVTKFNVNVSDMYFKNQHHSSLVTFVDYTLNSWGEDLGAQVVAMTYSPFSHNVAEILKRPGRIVSRIVLHEIDQERVLRQSVTEFFKTASAGSILLVQCDPLATSKRRIEHTKFLIEQERAKFTTEFRLRMKHPSNNAADQQSAVDGSGGQNIHVLLLVHLPRGNDDGDGKFLVDFDTRWKFAFVDSIEAANTLGLPDIEGMIGRTMKDIILTIDIPKVLQKSFRHSLSRLTYSYQRAHDEVRTQILMCMRCLENSSYIDVIKETINHTVTESAMYDFDISASSLDSRELQLAGTFQTALHMKILNTVSTIFGRIIAYVDRNSNMSLCLDPSLTERWVELFKRAFSLPAVKAKAEDDYVVICDGYGGYPFRAKFPFSFYMSSVFDSMRRAYEFQPELTLRTQLEMVSLASFQGEQDEQTINNYMFDLCCIKCKEVKSYSRDLQTGILARILCLIANEEVNSIVKLSYFSQIHYYLWQGERLIELYFELFGGNISRIYVLSDYLMNTATLFNDACHGDIILRFINELNPWNSWKQSTEAPTRQRLNEWIDRIDHVKTTVLSIIDLIKEESIKSVCVENWSLLVLFQVFVRDLGIPLELETSVLLDHVSQLREKPLVSREMLSSLIKTLERINIEILRQNVSGYEKHICPITQMRFVYPVIAADGITYERSAIENWMKSGNKTSPMTRAPFASFTLKPNLALQIELKETSECDLSRFLEYYIFDVVFSQSRRKSGPFSYMIIDLIALSSGRSPVAPEKDYYMNGVLPSDASCRGIIRELYKLTDATQKLEVSALVNDELIRTRELNSWLLDSPFMVSVVAVEEELMKVSPDPESINLLPIGKISSSDVVPRQVVDSVAAVRCILKHLAKSLCNLDIENDPTIMKSMMELSNRVSVILESSTSIDEKVTRQMRMYFLKVIERERGQSFVRSILMKEPIRSSKWLLQWLESSDVSISQFVGKDRLPRTNPFIPMPLYRNCQTSLAQYLTSGNIERLEHDLTILISSSDSKERVANLRSSLFAALFTEVSLLSVLPTHLGDSLLERVKGLMLWCSESSFMSKIYNLTERAILLLLCTGRNSSNEVIPAFSLSPDSNTDQILQIRLAVHMFASIMSASSSNPLAFFKSLINDPAICVDTYFPTMPEDLTKMAQTVLGGRFYACPNGHPFYVDACGGPTMEGKCFCGEKIGGLDHNLLATNKRIDGLGSGLFQKSNLEDKSEKNYCVRSVVEEHGDRFSSRRGLNAVSLRVMRLFMHTVMYTTSCATSGSYDLHAKNFLNTSYSNPSNLNKFLREHYAADWSYLISMLTRSVDDVSLILHLILLNASGTRIQNPTGQEATPAVDESALSVATRSFLGGLMSVANTASGLLSTREEPASAAAGASVEIDYRTLPTLDRRLQWETIFSSSYIAVILDKDIGAVLTAAATHLGDGQNGEISIFTTELLDKCNVVDLTNEDRLIACPGLWRYSKGFSLEHFTMSLQLVPTSAQRLPVLSSFMTDEIQLRGLRYLPAVFEWILLLTERYSGRMDKDVSRSKSCGEVLSEISLSDQPRWNSAFAGFCRAWNDLFPFVHRFGCLEIPSTYREIVMDSSTPVIFCLPCEKDEGLCTISLVTFMKNRHNDLVQLVDEMLLLRQRRNHREQLRAGDICSRFMTSAHALTYDLETELIPFFEKLYMQSSEGGTFGYDFAKAEAMLVDRYLVNLPAINLEVQGFMFAHEDVGSSGLSLLRRKIRQESLSRDLLSAIKRDLGNPAIAQSLLDQVETAISFLGGTGGSVVQTLNESQGEMLFSNYLKNILLVTEEIQSRAVVQMVRLCHLESLYHLLFEITHDDFTEKVSPLFRCRLSDGNRDALTVAASIPDFDISILLPAMKGIITNYLLDENLQIRSTTAPAKETLGYCEVEGVELMEKQWFQDHFPDTLPLGEILSAYLYLKEIEGKVNV